MMGTRKSARIALRQLTPRDKHPQTQRAPSPADARLESEPSTGADPELEDAEDTDTDTNARPAKRRKTQPQPRSTRKTSKSSTSTKTAPTRQTLLPPLSEPATTTTTTLPIFPTRAHPPSYHHPLLLTSPTARNLLLTWFTTALTRRPMPWRKPWTHPNNLSRANLSRRAYEVWISEVMLQQTRVAVVVGYWTRWMARWPTVRDLARAEVDEVLGMWTGLGYYARARRVWEAARVVCEGDEEGDGLLPGTVGELVKKVPGVGRYTAGAIAAIVFGVPAAMVDGNVLRVLSRQMGVLGDVKGDKRVVEMLWDAAEELARAVARDAVEDEDGDDEVPLNDRPGRWGQALMELGSTVCTPKPNCSLCPITETCRAYSEGLALAEKHHDFNVAADIEDLCEVCAPFDEYTGLSAHEMPPEKAETRPAKGDDRLSRFFATTNGAKAASKEQAAPSAKMLEGIVSHARKFPLRIPKKQLREEETLVCAIRCSEDSQYLICRRPAKGLLAGLWELPSHILPDSNDSTAKSRKKSALTYVSDLLSTGQGAAEKLRHQGELGSVPWLFSHLKLTMHVHLFEWRGSADLAGLGDLQRWAAVGDIDKENMGTGMKKCWSLVRERRQ